MGKYLLWFQIRDEQMVQNYKKGGCIEKEQANLTLNYLWIILLRTVMAMDYNKHIVLHQNY